MYICVEGCAHGELHKIYAQIEAHEREFNRKVDLLICCGDFQAARNAYDLASVDLPLNQLEMGAFYKYYNGTEKAPVLTIFVGGDLEASSYLQELAYGGWIAPNIYYLGYAGVIKINGIRIAGISGIFNSKNYRKGHFECPPYDKSDIRSACSIRNLEIFRLMQLKQSNLDIMISHDWPQGIWNNGDRTKRFGIVKRLLKPNFRVGKVCSPVLNDILRKLKPRRWYAAHLHRRFDAKIYHKNDQCTKFVALDKCSPARSYFEFTNIGPKIDRDADGNAILDLQYDPEWLAILVLTNKFMNATASNTELPKKKFTPKDDDIQLVMKRMGNDLTIKHNFEQTMESYDMEGILETKKPLFMINPQTAEFCEKLGIDDPYVIADYLKKCKND